MTKEQLKEGMNFRLTKINSVQYDLSSAALMRQPMSYEQLKEGANRHEEQNKLWCELKQFVAQYHKESKN